ncbi:MAG: flagellar motor protein [SAR86 cluster bacterium]|uniref:Flagellar motor protein n=1 Tax=SAR86 cluster bacterium TaxID=2030880 RepID=A0A2A5CBD5_9GAMM|nr:MAG: flagellar motor protein [SAR86 cluster bacterium]
MDVMTITGLIIGLVAIIGGNLLEGGHTESLLIFTAFFIVFGGTLGAVMVQTPREVFMLGLQRVIWMFVPPVNDSELMIKKIVDWSQLVRKEGLLSLQDIADEEEDGFSRNGLNMLADGSEPEVMRNILEIELSMKEQKELLAAKVWEGFGGYSPTIGIIGAVMGLIHVMNNLADPSKLGPGIAVAFVATIYGVGLANLIFLPMASKLKTLIASQSQYREMIIEGLVAIAEGENPRNIDSKLQGYL